MTSSNFNNCAAPCATSSHRDAGSPEMVNKAIRSCQHIDLFDRLNHALGDRLISRGSQMAIIGEGLDIDSIEHARQVDE